LLRKILSIVLITTFLTTSFTSISIAYQGETEKGVKVNENTDQTLVFEMNYNPDDIDPQARHYSDVEAHIINNMFEGLMREIDGKSQVAMAESYEIKDDKLTYIFHLRDAKWSDGRAVTAYDFEYSWKRALKPDSKFYSAYASLFYCIKGAEEYNQGEGSVDDVYIKAVDNKTLRVELSNPTSHFLSLTSHIAFMPTRRDIVEQALEVWSLDPELAVSNGPFKLYEYIGSDKMVLVKNNYYWDCDNVKLSKIEIPIIEDEATALDLYGSGELDIQNHVPVSEISRLQAENPGFKSFIYPGAYYYVFNVKKEPFNNAYVRRALSLAIDRKTIVETVTKKRGKVATGIVPTGFIDTDGHDFRKAAGDYGIGFDDNVLEEARDLLTKAGYPNGEGFPKIEILFNAYSMHRDIAETIQKMWKENLNIDVELTEARFSNLMNRMYKGDFGIGKGGWVADYGDPMTFLDMWTSDSEINYGQWKNEKYDKLIEDLQLKSGQERFHSLYKAEKMLMDEMVVMPIYYYSDEKLVKEKVKGLQRTTLGHWYFGRTYIGEQ